MAYMWEDMKGFAHRRSSESLDVRNPSSDLAALFSEFWRSRDRASLPHGAVADKLSYGHARDIFSALF